MYTACAILPPSGGLSGPPPPHRCKSFPTNSIFSQIKIFLRSDGAASPPPSSWTLSYFSLPFSFFICYRRFLAFFDLLLSHFISKKNAFTPIPFLPFLTEKDCSLLSSFSFPHLFSLTLSFLKTVFLCPCRFFFFSTKNAKKYCSIK